MKKMSFRFEKMAGRTIVFLMGFLVSRSAFSNEPVFIHQLPQGLVSIAPLIQDGSLYKARDLQVFFGFIKLKHQNQDLHEYDFLNTITIDDIKEYQEQLGPSISEDSGAPTCIC
jgi:hypothetical protein